MNKIYILVLSAIFLFACSSDGVTERETNNDAGDENLTTVNEDNDEVWANKNLDLIAVGSLLKDADDAAKFETLINNKDGVNNLDLNGDGYVDYLSVEEFEDRSKDQRGFTMLARFGPNDIQEIASLIFDRDRPDRQGTTFYVRGNEQMYGDNYNYEGNWLDKSLAIANWAFRDRNDYYRSSYYYDNYPDNYDQYRVISTPVYRDRIVRYQENPAMIKITTLTGKIKIKSRYPGRSYRRAHAKMAKPTKEQQLFFKNRRDKTENAGEKRAKQVPPGLDKTVKKDKKKDEKEDGQPADRRPNDRPVDNKKGNPPVKKNKAQKEAPKNKGKGKDSKPGKQ